MPADVRGGEGVDRRAGLGVDVRGGEGVDRRAGANYLIIGLFGLGPLLLRLKRRFDLLYNF